MPTLWFDLGEIDKDGDEIDYLYDDEELEPSDDDIICGECGAVVEDGIQCQECGFVVEIASPRRKGKRK